MQVDAKSEGLFGALEHGLINGVSAHWPALVRCPEAGVLISTGDTAAELIQVHIDARRHFSGNRKLERPPGLGIRSRNVERPKITRL